MSTYGVNFNLLFQELENSVVAIIRSQDDHDLG